MKAKENIAHIATKNKTAKQGLNKGPMAVF